MEAEGAAAASAAVKPEEASV
eukprot:COSAG02_NODE_42859_length_380_cov_0.950178_1_plen_20_part_10